MRIGVLHDSLNFAGGAERVCLKTIEALKEVGHHVILGTVEATDWDRVRRIMGPVATPDEEFFLLGMKRPIFRLYLSLLSLLIQSKVKTSCDLTICTNGDLMLLDTDLSYWHYIPICAAPNRLNLSFSPLLNAYTFPYKRVQHTMLANLKSSRLIANSSFSGQALETLLQRKADVIYPPVEVDRFSGAHRDYIREPTVVACGRFSPEKNFEFVLNVAAEVPEIEFQILGTFSGVLSRSYYAKLVSVKKSKQLSNVSISQSSFSTMLSAFRHSSLFLSSTIDESFGLSVVEAMSSGLVPIVHRSGGPWVDILQQQDGICGFSYNAVEDAVFAIKKAMTERRELARLSTNAARRASDFSDHVFKSRIRDEVAKTLANFHPDEH